MKAWPFLFAAGFVRDYQFIVCPGRFAEMPELAAFRSLIGPLTERNSDAPEVKTAGDPVLGNVVVVYACLPARVRGALALDVGHRSVSVVLGIVFDEAATVDADVISRARILLEDEKPELLKRFEDFWDKRVAVEPVKSGPIEVWPPSAKRVTPPVVLQRKPVSYRRMMVAASSMLLLASIVLNFHLTWQTEALNRQLTKEIAHSADLTKDLQALNGEAADLKKQVERLTQEEAELRNRNP